MHDATQRGSFCVRIVAALHILVREQVFCRMRCMSDAAYRMIEMQRDAADETLSLMARVLVIGQAVVGTIVVAVSMAKSARQGRVTIF